MREWHSCKRCGCRIQFWGQYGTAYCLGCDTLWHRSEYEGAMRWWEWLAVALACVVVLAAPVIYLLALIAGSR